MTLHKHSGQAGIAGTLGSLEHEIEHALPQPIITQKSPSLPANDDDYDNCDAWDDDLVSNEDQLVWENLSLSPRSSEQRKSSSDLADSDSDSDFDSTQDTRASLSMSTDSCSSEDELADLPHWWGNEDTDHVKELVDRYSEVSGVRAAARAALRAARPFVGKIVRFQVRSSDSSQLTSIDSVYVYLYDMVPFGRTMPRTQHLWFLTRWDSQTGLPLHQSLMQSSTVNRTWMRRANQKEPVALFCEPDAADPQHFIYSSAPSSSHRDFDSPLGYHNASFSWGFFFPESSPSSQLSNYD